MNPQMWLITWIERPDRPERFWGTIKVVEGGFVELTHYSGGVSGLPYPMDTRVVPKERIVEWRTDK